MECGYKSPGHNSAFKDQDGKIYIVYHQRFEGESEVHEPRVHQLFRTGNNWLTVCPFATDGEMLCPKNYHESEICGTFYVVEHGLDISNEIHRPLRVEFTRGGEILKHLDQSANPESPLKLERPYGYYTLDGESKITFSLNGITYEGVIVQLNDEAGNPTMCITGVGENQSAWAVQYLYRKPA